MHPDVPTPGAVLGPSALTVAAAWAPLRTRAAVRDLVAAVGLLGRRRGALELDLARLLAWPRRRDPVELQGVTWTAFCGEHVDWQGSWLRDMIRLAESSLGLVHHAVEDGILPLRQAVLAPGRVSVERVVLPRRAGEREQHLPEVPRPVPRPSRRYCGEHVGTNWVL